MDKQKIIIKTITNAPVEKVWTYWTEPEHIKKWNNASEDWHITKAENDLSVGGKFISRMEAKDGSLGFDFCGIYDEVKVYDFIYYTLGDEREVRITFVRSQDKTEITEEFEAENENSIEIQKMGYHGS